MQNKDLKEKAKFIMAKIREYYEDKVCGIICKADHRKGITIRTLI